MIKLIDEYINELKDNHRFSTNDEKNSESPGVIIWSIYLKGMYLDYFSKQNDALKMVEEGLKIAPTNIEFYLLRARIYKHDGNYLEAYKWMDYARKMDTADRYLNTKCARYAFRAGCFKCGEHVLRLFLRPSDHMDTMEELQVVWYTLSKGIGHSFYRQHKEALIEFERIFSVYEGVYKDQFDFHHYALRKATAITYLDMLKWQDELRRQTKFVRAAKHAIKAYIEMYDLSKNKKDLDSIRVKDLPEDNPPKEDEQK
eukprot:UN31543